MSKLFGGIFLIAIIFRKAFQDHATPTMMSVLFAICVISMVIVILDVLFGGKS